MEDMGGEVGAAPYSGVPLCCTCGWLGWVFGRRCAWCACGQAWPLSCALQLCCSRHGASAMHIPCCLSHISPCSVLWQASQALKLSEQQLKLRKQLERRQQEQAAAVCAAGNCNSEAGGGGGSSSGGGVLGRFERPTQEDVSDCCCRRQLCWCLCFAGQVASRAGWKLEMEAVQPPDSQNFITSSHPSTQPCRCGDSWCAGCSRQRRRLPPAVAERARRWRWHRLLWKR